MFSPAFGVIQPTRWDAVEVLSRPEINRWQFVRMQLEDPFVEIQSVSNKVIEWRLLFPLMAYATGMRPEVYAWLPVLGAFLCLSWLAWLLRRETASPWLSFLGTALFATGSWHFVAVGWLGYFDGWFMLALLLTAFSRSRHVLLVTALLAPWVDERFILALPMVLGLRFLFLKGWEPEQRKPLLKDAVCVLTPAIAYLVLRLAVLVFGSDGHSGFMLEGMLAVIGGDQWPLVLWGLWEGLRAGFILLGACLFWSYRDAPRWAFFTFLGLVALSTLVSMTIAGDTARSASVLWPLAVAGILMLAREQKPLALWFCGGTLAANLLLPAYLVFLVDQRPIRSLTEELDRIDSYTVAKDPQLALRYADYANYLVNLHDQDGALQVYDDIVYANSLEASMPLYLVKRAELHLARGDRAAATGDVQTAWTLSRPGSSQRRWLVEHYGDLLRETQP